MTRHGSVPFIFTVHAALASDPSASREINAAELFFGSAIYGTVEIMQARECDTARGTVRAIACTRCTTQAAS